MSTENDKWLRAMLQSAPADRTAACLDAEQLAAWSDSALNAQERAEVELHMSSCAHCMAAFAALQRTMPAATPHAFDRSRVFRWLVPIMAAATAVAIWIAVPDRQRPVEPTSSTVRPAASPQAPTVPETQTQAPEAANQPAERESARTDSAPLRDEVRGRREVDTMAKTESSDLSTLAPPAASPAPVAPPPAAAPSAKMPSGQLGAARESAADAKFRAAAPMSFAPTVSISPSEPSARWRVMNSGTTIERSTDGGQSWMPVKPVPGVSVGPPPISITFIRAVDANRAVATTSDSREFYTTDGGASWTAVQENQAAPF